MKLEERIKEAFLVITPIINAQLEKEYGFRVTIRDAAPPRVVNTGPRYGLNFVASTLKTPNGSVNPDHLRNIFLPAIRTHVEEHPGDWTVVFEVQPDCAMMTLTPC